MILLYKAKENGLSSGSDEGENDSQICFVLSREPVEAPDLKHTKNVRNHLETLVYVYLRETDQKNDRDLQGCKVEQGQANQNLLGKIVPKIYS